MDEGMVREALGNSKVHDFEDGMQYYSAIGTGCKVLVTENKEDFYFSEMEVLGCEEFIMKYFSKDLVKL